MKTFEERTIKILNQHEKILEKLRLSYELQQSTMYWHIERLIVKRNKIQKEISDRVMFRIESPELRKRRNLLSEEIERLRQKYYGLYGEQFSRPYGDIEKRLRR